MHLVRISHVNILGGRDHPSCSNSTLSSLLVPVDWADDAKSRSKGVYECRINSLITVAKYIFRIQISYSLED